ncbi:MAG: hypothetical protein LBK61_11205 [Spirochaetaceae bacterium]|jgi:hypothetical protein|nr:hypothetical protein [Spirochaetaceae bacterium]
MVILVGLFLLWAAVSCSRAEPVIRFQAMKLVYYQNDTGFDERLTFFVLPDDPDGTDDVDELYLYHDLEGLSWKLTSADWIQRQQDNRLWIGAYGLAPPPGEKLPSGLYRAVIIDKGGEKSERTFGFDVPDTPHYPFPELTIADGEYTIKSDYPELRFIGFGTDGTYLSTVNVSAFSGRVADIGFANNITSFALWADDSERSTAALTVSHPAR